jgi:hypothetical protein
VATDNNKRYKSSKAMWEGCILPRHKQKMAKQIYRTLIEPSFNTVALLGDASECIGHNFYFAFRGVAGSNVLNGFLQSLN